MFCHICLAFWDLARGRPHVANTAAELLQQYIDVVKLSTLMRML